MGAVLPVDARVVNEFEICFVDQRGRLKSMTAAFIPQIIVGDFFQFAVNQRENVVDDRLIAL